MYEELVNSNNYIRHLEHLNIDTEELKKDIQNEIESKQDIFEDFWNRSKKLNSPNINLENIIFTKSNQYIYQNYKNEFKFDISFKLDMKSLIASKNSLVERPNIQRPSQIENNVDTEMQIFDNYIQIARFEHELDLGYYGKNKVQHIIFEGLTPSDNQNPFFEYLPSALIWLDAFYYQKEEKIIGLYKNFNSIESKYILWINSLILDVLELELDNCNNGFKALNIDGDVILEFRCWRDELIDNGASFVGTDSNIASLEGCDLILREDYFNKLNSIRHKYKFVSKKLRLD